MSISAVPATFNGNGPAKTGQVLVSASEAGTSAKQIAFTATAVLDGSSTSFHMNYIDGTQTIPSPSGLIVTACGGTAAATVSVLSAVTHNASTGQDDYAVITISGADTNANTLKIAGVILF